jgi:hypothetical protein
MNREYAIQRHLFLHLHQSGGLQVAASDSLQVLTAQANKGVEYDLVVQRL